MFSILVLDDFSCLDSVVIFVSFDLTVVISLTLISSVNVCVISTEGVCRTPTANAIGVRGTPSDGDRGSFEITKPSKASIDISVVVGVD
uniref:CSON014497 protein n=1 Tax=Culicoides sonorensis TaxID=179676 RepID=A0A336MAN4_CULSO